MWPLIQRDKENKGETRKLTTVREHHASVTHAVSFSVTPFIFWFLVTQYIDSLYNHNFIGQFEQCDNKKYKNKIQKIPAPAERYTCLILLNTTENNQELSS